MGGYTEGSLLNRDALPHPTPCVLGALSSALWAAVEEVDTMVGGGGCIPVVTQP